MHTAQQRPHHTHLHVASKPVGYLGSMLVGIAF